MKYAFIMSAFIFTFSSYASCWHKKRSCLTLNNRSNQQVEIFCEGSLTVPARTKKSKQLDLSIGDGLGAPYPHKMQCQLNLGNSNPFEFTVENPYWGSVLDFTLSSNSKRLKLVLTDGWRQSNKIILDYLIN